MWWFCFEAQVVPENYGGPGCCCRRGMNCCCAVRAHARPSLARIRELGSTVTCSITLIVGYGIL